MILSVELALKDLRHEWQSAACFVAALVGILAPLLIILALKNGLIVSMLERLVDDPSNRELIAVGARYHDASFFEDLGARDDVDFIMPATRTINAQANAVRHEAARRLVRKVVLIPSAPGDPLSTDADVAPGSVLLSTALADDLDAEPGDTLELRIERRIGDAPETATRDVNVEGIVSAQLYSRPALFLSLADLVAIERFRDDEDVTVADWYDDRPLPESFASFRLYAATLGDIDKLEHALEDRGVEARPRARNVALLLSVRRNADLLFWLVAALAAFGFWAAMAANLRGAVERQRVSLSLLSLLGLRETGRRAIPAIQAVVLVVGGVALTLLLVLPVLALVNRAFTPEGFDQIAWLGLGHIVGALVLGLVTAVTASAWAVIAIKDIEPDEVLRSA